MRPVETLLLIANALSFLVLFVPLPRVVRGMRHVAPVALLLAIAQMLMEGPRWQLAPAYALSGLFILVWLRQTIGQRAYRPGKNRRIDSASAGDALVSTVSGARTSRLFFGLGVLILAISTVLPTALPVFHFPKPGGSYEIGTVTYHWTDASRHEVFSTDKNARRELMGQVWYPAEKGSSSSSSHTPYIQDSDVIATALARLHNLPSFSLGHLKYVTTNAAESVPVASDKPSYPVLIFVEGLTGYRQMNTFQVDELVSRGYIVVGIDQPGVAASVVFPDGHHIAGLSKAQADPLTQQSVSPAEETPLLNGQAFEDGIIPYLAQDISFTLDQLASINSTASNNILTGKLDLQRTGMFGVSFGAIVGAEACLKEPRLKACLMMDAVMTTDVVQQGLQQPSMWITRDVDTMRLERRKSGGWSEKDIEQTQTTMRAVYNRLPGAGYFVQLPGMFHIDLTDLTYLSPAFPMVGLSGPIGRATRKVAIGWSRSVLGARGQAEDGQEQGRVVFDLPDGGGDLGVAGLADQADREVAQGGHDSWSGGGADL